MVQVNENATRRANGISRFVVILVLLTALLAAALLIAGCDESGEVAKKQQQFKTQWLDIMEVFQGRVNSDDSKADKLVQKNDLAGLIELIKLRISNVDSVLGKVLPLYPPDNLRKLQVTTLYYLQSLMDQLVAQNNLNEAVLSGNPTADLQTIAGNAAAKTKALGRELGIEMQKVGVKLQVLNQQSQQAPAGQSAVQSQPSGK